MPAESMRLSLAEAGIVCLPGGVPELTMRAALRDERVVRVRITPKACNCRSEQKPPQGDQSGSLITLDPTFFLKKKTNRCTFLKKKCLKNCRSLALNRVAIVEWAVALALFCQSLSLLRALLVVQVLCELAELFVVAGPPCPGGGGAIAGACRGFSLTRSGTGFGWEARPRAR